VLLGTQLGAAPLERAEIYFVDAARAMVESGDYLVPRYKGQPFFDKPPLAYWLMAACFETFGFHLWAARLVPVTAALALLAATLWLGRLLFDRATGLLGAVVLGTTLLFLSFGRVAMSDMLLAAFSTLAVCLGAIVLQQAPASPLLMAALGSVLGLGFLTKGPVALLLPGLGLMVLARRQGRWFPRATASGWILALLCSVALGLGWFALLYARLGPEPLRYFFLRENLERFAGETYDAQRSPFYYVGAYLAVGLPWSLLFPLAAWRASGAARVLLLWMGLMLVPLSLSRGKIDYYLLPLAPAGALLVAAYLRSSPQRALDRGWFRVVAVGVALLLGGVLAVGARMPAEWLPGVAARGLLWAVVALGMVAAAAVLVRPLPSRVIAALGGTAAALFLVLITAFLPTFRRAQPNQELLDDVTRELRYRPDLSMAACTDPARVEREILFYARRAVESRCDLWAVASSSVPYLIVATPREAESFAAVPTVREIRRYHTLPATALTLRGLFEGIDLTSFRLLANFATTDPVAETKRKKDRKQALAGSDGTR
jgi:4-amino-4-deoxy-L-arabinose transferase-like glycosyltransferase